MNRAGLNQYLIQAKIEELKDEWEAKGYQIVNEQNGSDIRADLVLRRNGETVVFEVTTGDLLKGDATTSVKLATQVLQNPNTSFHLVVTNPPREKIIEIEGLDRELLVPVREKFIEIEGLDRALLVSLVDDVSKNTLSQLDRRSSQTIVDLVDNTDLTAVSIRPGEIKARGTGFVSVRLEYEPGSDQEVGVGVDSRRVYPFEFAVTLDSNVAVISVDRLEIDKSEFDE